MTSTNPLFQTCVSLPRPWLCRDAHERDLKLNDTFSLVVLALIYIANLLQVWEAKQKHKL